MRPLALAPRSSVAEASLPSGLKDPLLLLGEAAPPAALLGVVAPPALLLKDGMPEPVDMVRCGGSSFGSLQKSKRSIGFEEASSVGIISLGVGLGSVAPTFCSATRKSCVTELPRRLQPSFSRAQPFVTSKSCRVRKIPSAVPSHNLEIDSTKQRVEFSFEAIKS